MGNFISVGMLKDQMVIALPNSGTTTSLLGSNEMTLSYSNEALANLNGKQMREVLAKSTIPFWIKAVTFIITIYPSFLNLLITLIIASFAGYIYARLRLTRATFLDCLKTMIYAITLPTLLSTVLLIFVPTFDTSIFITLVGLFIFIQASKGWPRFQLPKQ